MSDTTFPEAPRRNPHVSRVRSGFDKAGFLVFTAIGAAGIIGLKLLGYPQVIVTLFPLGVMVVYALILLFSPRLQLRDDQAGDNIYYLGFLYTLVTVCFCHPVAATICSIVAPSSRCSISISCACLEP